MENMLRLCIQFKSDGKCIWEYYDGKCDSTCENCPHYRPDYKGMKYTEALQKLNDVMQGREDIKEVKFDKENDTFEVIDMDGNIHIRFGSEFK